MKSNIYFLKSLITEEMMRKKNREDPIQILTGNGHHERKLISLLSLWNNKNGLIRKFGNLVEDHKMTFGIAIELYTELSGGNKVILS